MFVDKIPENFLYLILQDKFWVVEVPLVRMVKFRFFAQLPVDFLPHTVVSSFTFFLHQFTAFAFNMMNGFISITT